MVAVLHLDPMLRPAGLIGPLPMLRELDDANAAWLRTVGAKVLGKTLSQRYYYHLLCPHPEGVMMIKVSLVLAAVIAAVPCTAQEVRVFSGGEQHVYGPGGKVLDSPELRAKNELSRPEQQRVPIQQNRSAVQRQAPKSWWDSNGYAPPMSASKSWWNNNGYQPPKSAWSE
jgi:hypothetical protein